MPASPRRVLSPKVYYVLSSESFPVEHLVRHGVEAELAGFDGVWTSDHFQPWQANEGHSAPAWVTLAALTQRTSRMSLGTGVTCPSFRYRPAVIAQVWAGLSALAPGRVFLGLGTGERLNEGAAGGGWGGYRERLSRLVEAVRMIRSLWTGKQVRIRGRFWDVDCRLYDPPKSAIPIYIAAGGLRSARAAGVHGDGLVLQGSTLEHQPEVKAAWQRERRRRGGAVVVEHWAIVGGGKEADAAAREWRFGPKAWERGFFDSVSPVAIQSLAEKEVPLREAVKSWTVSRNCRDHEVAIRRLASLGATHVVVHVPTRNQSEAIGFFGREVLPALRGPGRASARHTVPRSDSLPRE